MSPALHLDPALRTTLDSAFTVLFAWAAAHKLRDVAAFRAALAAYALLPARAVAACAAACIAAEIGIAAALLLPGFAPLGTLAAALLLCAYAGAMAINLWRGRRDIDCGCVGAAARRPLSSALVVRNAVLVVLALAATLPATTRTFAWIDAVTIAAGMFTLALLYAAVDGLIANAPRSTVLAHRQSHPDLFHASHPYVDHA